MFIWPKNLSLRNCRQIKSIVFGLLEVNLSKAKLDLMVILTYLPFVNPKSLSKLNWFVYKLYFIDPYDITKHL